MAEEIKGWVKFQELNKNVKNTFNDKQTSIRPDCDGCEKLSGQRWYLWERLSSFIEWIQIKALICVLYGIIKIWVILASDECPHWKEQKLWMLLTEKREKHFKGFENIIEKLKYK